MKLSAAYYAGKRVLITGHTGFKGTWMCRLLAGMGARVTGYALEPPTEPSLFALCGAEKAPGRFHAGIRFVKKIAKPRKR